MKFRVEIELGNDAMSSPRHVRTALRELEMSLRTVQTAEMMHPLFSLIIRDVNGNTVGKATVDEE